MNRIKLVLQAAIIMGALGLSTPAAAQAFWTGGWGAASHGVPMVDAHTSVVQVVPPNGGTVMLYQGDKLKRWWWYPGFETVRPGEVYGVVATRGTSLLFNGAMVFRPGLTTLVWEKGADYPLVGYQPAAHAAARPVTFASPAHRTTASGRSAIPAATYRGLLIRLDAKPRDADKLRVVAWYADRYRFRPSEASAVVARFKSGGYGRTAARLLRRAV